MAVNSKWVGKSLRRSEDVRLLVGQGTFTDDLKLPGLFHAAILRSPHAHARILSIDTSRAEAHPGVVGVVTGADVKRMSKPFPAGMPVRLRYYSAAIDRVRFVGEPVAVVVATSRYVAEDALDLVRVDYEPLPAVVDAEAALEPDAPLLHEEVGTNRVNHRILSYGDVDAAFAAADEVIAERFYFHRYSSTPIETCVVVARFDPATGVMTLWSNFHGPYSLHSFVAKGLDLPGNRLRLITPADIGGSFGIKIGITTYLTLIGVAARKLGRPVKWVEDRAEHLAASSSHAERTAYYEMAAQRDGTILGVRAKYIDNNGAFIRAPEPASLYRTTGNTVGPYRFAAVRIDANAVATNKSPTGPNRGYGCQQLYFCMERMVDLLAGRLGIDPAEIRQHNLIQPGEFPYTTPTGGVYDSGDYPAGLKKALEMADYAGLRREQERARAAGRLMGIGIAVAVEPCVTNMGYLNIAFTPEERAARGFHNKSGAGEAAMLRLDPMGQITAIVASAPSGQSHDLLVSQVVADELGVTPDAVTVITEMDTSTRVWTISTGNYSSRFASAGVSAFAQAGRMLRDRILAIAASRLDVPADELTTRDGKVFRGDSPKPLMDFREIAGLAHWNPNALPAGMEPGVQVTHVFNYAPAKALDEHDHVNSSSTYGFIAEVVAVEVDRATGQVKIGKYVSVHDAGVLVSPQRVEGQVYGGILHGLGGALYEDMAYGPSGQFLAGSFMDYLCPTAMEAPRVEIGHIVTPSPFSTLGTKGCGEGSAITAPAAIANAVNDALAPLGVALNRLPLSPSTLWHAMRAPNGGGGRC